MVKKLYGRGGVKTSRAEGERGVKNIWTGGMLRLGGFQFFGGQYPIACHELLTCFKTLEPLQRDNLLFTTKSIESLGHLYLTDRPRRDD